MCTPSRLSNGFDTLAFAPNGNKAEKNKFVLCMDKKYYHLTTLKSIQKKLQIFCKRTLQHAIIELDKMPRTN